jgi:hypothetical protein
MRKIGDFNSMNKKGQFFILSAVIIASIIVGLATTKNYVSTGDAPKKFYYYSQQLEDETGAVVDYALYNDPNGDDPSIKQNLDSFLQLSIDRALQSDPNMEIFACYSNATTPGYLICQNNGTTSMVINTSLDDSITVAGSKSPVKLYGDFGDEILSSASIFIANKNLITVTSVGGRAFNIPIQSSSVQRSQFYFMLKMNTSSGDYISDSTGVKKT